MNLLVQDAHYEYPDGTPALRGVDLDLPSGSTVALLGPNGAGKTTLARLLNGLLVPRSGRVLVGDLDTADVPASRVAARVGYVFQNPRRQVFAATVHEEVAFGPRNLGLAHVEEAVETALALVGLAHRAGAHPYELTPSELRRVALASVLSMETPVVVLDEPTASLDGPDHERLLAVLAHLRAKGVTLALITHDLDFAAEECERVVVLRDGRVAAEGPPEEVFARPDVQRPSASRIAAALGLSPGLCRQDLLLEATRRPGGGGTSP